MWLVWKFVPRLEQSQLSPGILLAMDWWCNWDLIQRAVFLDDPAIVLVESGFSLPSTTVT